MIQFCLGKREKVERWKSSLIRYFEAGEKQGKEKRLGVEVEHFVVDQKTKKAVPYAGENGIREVLSRLMELYPGAVILQEDEFLGFSVPEFNITLEPAAQLEISIIPDTSIRRIGEIYRGFSGRLSTVLSDLGYEALAVGCQPVSRVEDLTLIPKRRYAWMNEYFRTSGSGGAQMMRGSASTQVSVDYTSEEDFRRKIQAAYYYGPVFKLLMDNAAVFQGEKVEGRLKRTDIWRRTDPARCGILPGIFNEHYGFEDYADFLGSMPPIFLKHGKDMELTGKKTVAEIFRDKEMDEELVTHVLSMAFPDVRLKQYLEIRFADSAPLPFVLAYCALLKGLLYSESGIGYAQDRIRKGALREQDILLAEDAMTKRGWDAEIYKIPAASEAKRLLDLAKRELPNEEKACLDPFEEVLSCGSICGIPGKMH